MKNDSIYREGNRRSHKLLGTYLALWAWVNKVDCVILEREDLLAFLRLKKMEEARLSWLQEDVRHLLPHAQPLYRAKGNAHASLYLSRVKFPPDVFDGSASTQEQIRRLEKAGIRASSWVLILSEEEIVAKLAKVVHGLEDFSISLKRVRLQRPARVP